MPDNEHELDELRRRSEELLKRAAELTQQAREVDVKVREMEEGSGRTDGLSTDSERTGKSVERERHSDVPSKRVDMKGSERTD